MENIEKKFGNDRLYIQGNEIFLGMYWRPIETAPNFEDIIIYFDGAILIARKVDDGYVRWYRGSYYDCKLKPTHWMPLPEKPNETS